MVSSREKEREWKARVRVRVSSSPPSRGAMAAPPPSSPSPPPAAAAAATQQTQPQPQTPFYELVKGNSGLEKVLLRGTRGFSAEVSDPFSPANPNPTLASVPLSLLPFVVCVCGGGARFVRIRAPLPQIRREFGWSASGGLGRIRKRARSFPARDFVSVGMVWWRICTIRRSRTCNLAGWDVNCLVLRNLNGMMARCAIAVGTAFMMCPVAIDVSWKFVRRAFAMCEMLQSYSEDCMKVVLWGLLSDGCPVYKPACRNRNLLIIDIIWQGQGILVLPCSFSRSPCTGIGFVVHVCFLALVCRNHILDGRHSFWQIWMYPLFWYCFVHYCLCFLWLSFRCSYFLVEANAK